VAATSAPYSRSQRRSHSTPVKPLSARLSFVAVRRHEGVPYGPLLGGGRGQTENGNHPAGIYHEGHLEAVDPLGLGGAPAEGGLPAEEPLLASLALTRTMAGMRVVSITRYTAEGSQSSSAMERCRARNCGSRARALRLNWPWEQRCGK
jgi:hypothetical protein